MLQRGNTSRQGDCANCSKANEVDDMVQCDGCEAWWHYGCAGVDQTVSVREWVCVRCPKKITGDKEEDLSEHTNGNADKTIIENRAISLAQSQCSNRSRARFFELELEKLEEEQKMENQFIREREQKQKLFLERKFEILRQKEKELSVNSSKSGVSASRTEKWVRVNQYIKQAAEYPAVGIQAEQLSSTLTQNQIASRKGLSKDLPIFTGKAEDWPIFISNFKNSTELCNYSNAENLARLQRAIKGDAYKAVCSQLLLPSAVPYVIKSLEMLFGRPEHIIQDLITKVRSEPSPRLDRMDMIISYALTVKNLSSTMQASGLENHLNNPLMLQELVDKLPASLKLEWAMQLNSELSANIKEFGDWLYVKAEAVSKVSRFIPVKYEKRSGHLHTHSDERYQYEGDRSKELSQGGCYACNQSHRLVDCSMFAKLNCSDKWKLVKEKNLCEICLRHVKKFKCRELKTCTIDGCKDQHHKLLHRAADAQNHQSQEICNAHQCKQEAWFRILPVTLYSCNKQVHTFAFLDSGSSLTMIEEEISMALELDGHPEPICLKWTGNTTRWEDDSKVVSLLISGRSDNEVKHEKYELHGVRTIKELALPIQSLQCEHVGEQYSYLKGLPLPSYNKAKCGILIGLNNEKVSLPLKICEGRWNEPVAVKTRLGWCLSGGETTSGEDRGVYHNYEACECDKALHDIVQKHFVLKDTGLARTHVRTAEEVHASEILKSTTKRVGNAFECGLLWRYDDISMPESYVMAFDRLKCLEKKLASDPAALSSVNEQIKNLIAKGYARKCDPLESAESHPKTWYLPTFIVTNHNKPGKQRLVWDAAATTHGVSLNSMLHKGPDQLTNLPEVLYGFRSNKIAIAADIQEMFHQIRVRKQDQCSQKFLWREGHADRKPDVYEILVLTFGASCSPSIAQYVKNLNATEFANKFPRAAESILEHHYVDDLLDSVETQEEAIRLAKDIRYVHSKAGFNIRNWLSNSMDVLRALDGPVNGEGRTLDNSQNLSSAAKVLGLWWKPSEDVFTFSLTLLQSQKEVLSGKKVPTKRQLLRVLMSIFDPLGFLAFFMVRLKILLQEVWRMKVDWDEAIAGQMKEDWESWRRLLSKVESVSIPRCYTTLSGNCNIQLHIFVDAIEDAMAVVAYLRFFDGISTECAMVGAKIKVSPLLPMSIPRMELQAALMGSRMACSVSRSHKFQITKRVLWTDSRNVLQWLWSDARQYKQFVMFRVSEIQENTKQDEWRWVPSKLNVADEATKWSKLPNFDKESRWFQAPSFLYKREEEWPVEVGLEMEVLAKEEVRPKYLLVADIVHSSQFIDFQRFSSWERLQRSTGWVFRYVQNLRRKVNQQAILQGPLTADELGLAETRIWKMVQTLEYEDEIKLLRRNKGLPRSSQLFKLSPYFDADEVLRLKGRIEYADYVDEYTKHPVLLSRKNKVSSLIVDFYHRKYKHSCNETVINEIKQRYCIPGLRVLVKSVRNRCLLCQIKNAAPKCPEMAPLPRARLAAFRRPFTFVGVDYFGPIMVSSGRSLVKRWGVLFTCLTIRAIHVEAAYSLTTNSCIMCINNFMARRGTPSEIYSDNGTNFVGAERELREAFQAIDKDVIKEKFTTPETRWFFNPPSAPHMGGSWERLIGSVKKVFKEVVQNQHLNDETLHSLLTEVEGIINSRPLTYVTLENEEDEALTPNHFLLGSSSGFKLPVEFNSRELMSRKDWRRCQQLTNMFWKRWIREYLPSLTRRAKWFEKVDPVKPGDIVLIVDENLPKYSWPKGVVISIITSKDGQVRRATVRIANGIYDRPVVKLAVLNVSKKAESTEAEAPILEGRNVADVPSLK